MQVMKERDDERQLSGIVQIDDAYYGVERHGGKRGRGSENKVPFIAAVSTNGEGHPINMNFHAVEEFQLTEVSRWAKKHLSPDCLVLSDGLVVTDLSAINNYQVFSTVLPYFQLCG